MTPLFRKFLGLNWLLVANIAGLAIFGVFAIYSASWMREDSILIGKWQNHVRLLLLGFSVFLVMSLIDYKWIRKLGLVFYGVALVLLVYTTFHGDDVHGTRGWLDLKVVQIQPSQIAIAAGIIALALSMSTLHRVHPVFRSPFLRLSVICVMGGLPFVFVLMQGDLGSALVWIPVVGAMALMGNIPFRYLIVIVLIATMLLPFVYFFKLKDYQKKRVTTQIEMLQGKKVDIQGDAYNAYYNLVAIGSGGWAGKGFKNIDTVNHKGFITPETAINDFIFPVLAEVWGFRGALMVLAGFLLLLIQCLYVAFYSRDAMGRLLAVGVVGLIFAHVFQNVGMNLLIMPITGIPLPLISYGGTFSVVVMFLLGMVDSVWVHREDREDPVPRHTLQIDHLD